MHEISIINSVIKTLEEEFEASKLERLAEIHMQIGLLSNIEPILLNNAFDAFILSNPNYKEVTLKLETLPVKIRCELCQKESLVNNYKFYCAQCHKPSKNIISGNELNIRAVSFKD